jgi:hypothetical protein
VLEKLRAKGIEPGLVHAANPRAVPLRLLQFDAVRVGSALTGGSRPNTAMGCKGRRSNLSGSGGALAPEGLDDRYGGAYKTKQINA